MTCKPDLSYIVADLREITLACKRGMSTVNMPLKVSNDTNNCLRLRIPYRSEFTAASRGFPAAVRLSCH